MSNSVPSPAFHFHFPLIAHFVWLVTKCFKAWHGPSQLLTASMGNGQEREGPYGPSETVIACTQNQSESARQTLGLCVLSLVWVQQARQDRAGGGAGLGPEKGRALPPASRVWKLLGTCDQGLWYLPQSQCARISTLLAALKVNYRSQNTASLPVTFHTVCHRGRISNKT